MDIFRFFFLSLDMCASNGHNNIFLTRVYFDLILIVPLNIIRSIFCRFINFLPRVQAEDNTSFDRGGDLRLGYC